jgi:hypothetical protein
VYVENACKKPLIKCLLTVRRYVMRNRRPYGEVALSQCDKCGSEVPPDQITEDDPWREIKILLIGVILGGFIRQLAVWLQIG